MTGVNARVIAALFRVFFLDNGDIEDRRNCTAHWSSSTFSSPESDSGDSVCCFVFLSCLSRRLFLFIKPLTWIFRPLFSFESLLLFFLFNFFPHSCLEVDETRSGRTRPRSGWREQVLSVHFLPRGHFFFLARIWAILLASFFLSPQHYIDPFFCRWQYSATLSAPVSGRDFGFGPHFNDGNGGEDSTWEIDTAHS